MPEEYIETEEQTESMNVDGDNDRVDEDRLARTEMQVDADDNDDRRREFRSAHDDINPKQPSPRPDRDRESQAAHGINSEQRSPRLNGENDHVDEDRLSRPEMDVDDNERTSNRQFQAAQARAEERSSRLSYLSDWADWANASRPDPKVHRVSRNHTKLSTNQLSLDK